MLFEDVGKSKEQGRSHLSWKLVMLLKAWTPRIYIGQLCEIFFHIVVYSLLAKYYLLNCILVFVTGILQ